MPKIIQIDPYWMATRFIGLTEIAGEKHNDLVMAMLRLDNDWPNNDETPWCSAFVNYVCWLLDLQRSKSLMARSWLKVGYEIELDDAIKGWDIVILNRPPNPASGHVGFFSYRQNGEVFLLGGNQGDSVSIQPYSVDRVIGVRRL